MSRESKTPRTDAAASKEIGMSSITPGWYVHADFARDLERELAVANARLNFMATQCGRLFENALGRWSCQWIDDEGDDYSTFFFNSWEEAIDSAMAKNATTEPDQ